MRNSFAIFIFFLLYNLASSQTTIYNDVPGFSIVAVTGPDPLYEVNIGSIDISNCTSIQLSYNFMWTMDWEGGGNMESPEECNFGNPCAGDPTNPIAGDCNNCWDFLYGQFFIDGIEISNNLLGGFGETEQSGSVDTGPFCTNGGEDFDIEFDCAVYGTNPNEGITVSNIMILCWEGIPSIDTNSPICTNDDLDLNGSAIDESIISSWLWSNSGSGLIDNNVIQSTFAIGTEDLEVYTLEVTDENNCTASDEIAISITEPLANDLLIQGCETFFVSVNLNDYNDDINSTETVTWYSGQPSMGGMLLDPDDDVNILQNTNLWALVTDSNGCTSEVLIGLTITGVADPIDAGPLQACNEGGGIATFNLTSLNNIITGGFGLTVNWYEDIDLTILIVDPSNYSSGSTTLYVTVFNGVCESFSEDIEIEVIDSPSTSFTGGDALCPNECTTLIIDNEGGSGVYDLTFNIFIPGTGNLGFVLPDVNGDADIDVCYGPGGLILDPIGYNVVIAEGTTGPVVITLESVIDNDSPFCESLITPQDEINIPLEGPPSPNDAGPLQGCNDGSGNGIFDLTSLDEDINGGSGATVNWYTDIDATVMISDPTMYVAGNSLVYATISDMNCESNTVEISLEVLPELTYFLSGDIILCPGQCEDVTFSLDGGSGTYNLDVTFVFLGIPIIVPMGGVMSGVKITICYDGTGLLPSYDSGSMTLTIPTSIQLNGSLTIDGMSDFEDPFCDGFSGGQSTAVIDLLDGITAEEPDALYLCDEGGGFATFDISSVESQILNGNNGVVKFYSDPSLMNEIFSPYNTMTTTVYAVIDDGGCISNSVELDLEVIDNGDVGDVYLSCEENMPSDICTICDQDGIAGELFGIYFNTPFPGQYNITIEYVIDGTSIITTYSDVFGPGLLDEFNITQVSTFTLLSVEQIGVTCPDETDLGSPVIITYIIQPEIDPIGPLNGCDEVELPPITGSNFSNTPFYYSEQNGSGIIYSEGDFITESTVIYIYSGVDDCFDEEEVIINLGGSTTYDQPNDVVQCESYILPTITGENVGNNAQYYTEPNGGGISYPPGFELNMSNTSGSITLFIFDLVSTCANNEPFFMVTITDGPTFTNENLVNACSNFTLSEITGNNLSGNEYYSTEENGLGDILSPGEQFSVSDTIYLYDESNGCIAIDSVIINIYYPLNVGEDVIVKFCEGYPELLNLMDLLGGSPEVGGVWEDESLTGLDLSDSTEVNISSLSLGIYDFSYNSNSVYCTNNSSSVFIEILPDVTAGLDTMSNYCVSNMFEIDLNSYLNGNNSQGVFIDNLGDTVLSPTMLDLSNSIGSFVYTFITNDINQCSADTSLITINIQDSNYAGDSTATSICLGSMIDLSELLSNNNGNGIFEDVDNTGGLTGSVFDSNDLNEDIYTFYHIIPASGSCLADTSIIEVTVAASVYAGETDSLQVCVGTSVNLLSGLINEDAGGLFFVENMVSNIPNIYNTSINGPGEYSFIYVVGDNITCSQDTSEVYLNVVELPQLDVLLSQNTICEGETANIILTNLANLPADFEFAILKNGQQVFNQQKNDSDFLQAIELIIDENSGIILENNSLILNEYDVEYTFVINGINNGFCNIDTTILINFYPFSSYEDDYISSICAGQTITIGPDTYDENNLTGTTVLPTINGCDSTIHVMLTLANSVNGPDFVMNTCDDTEVFMIGGEIFDINNSTGDVIFNGASQGGCDSIISVVITYEQAVTGPDFFRQTCDSNEEFIVEGEIFTISNSSGIVTINGGAANGCDSIFMVEIQYLNDVYGEFNNMTCDESYSITIGNMNFDIDNPTGEATLFGGASNGCDSLVQVSIEFSEEIQNEYIYSTCDESYSIIIGGQTFDIDNPMGQVTIPDGSLGGCDTLVTVNLTFENFNADFNIYDEDCQGMNGGIEFNNISSGLNLIYTISTETGNVSIPELPYLVALDAGEYQLEVSNDQGCFSTYNIEILSTSSYNSLLTATLISENSYQLNLTTDGNIVEYDWTPTFGLSCTDCQNPIATINAVSEYFLNIIFEDGCIESLSIILDFEEQPDITLPNIFTPNGDGANEIFYFSTLDDNVMLASFYIFDRWGSKVFSQENIPASDPQYGWDGKFNGSDAAQGVYVFYIKAINPVTEEIIEYSGDLTLIR